MDSYSYYQSLETIEKIFVKRSNEVKEVSERENRMVFEEENYYTEHKEVNIITRSRVFSHNIETMNKSKLTKKPPAIPPPEDKVENVNNSNYINVPDHPSKEDLDEMQQPPRPPKKNQVPHLPPKKDQVPPLPPKNNQVPHLPPKSNQVPPLLPKNNQVPPLPLKKK